MTKKIECTVCGKADCNGCEVKGFHQDFLRNFQKNFKNYKKDEISRATTSRHFMMLQF